MNEEELRKASEAEAEANEAERLRKIRAGEEYIRNRERIRQRGRDMASGWSRRRRFGK